MNTREQIEALYKANISEFMGRFSQATKKRLKSFVQAVHKSYSQTKKNIQHAAHALTTESIIDAYTHNSLRSLRRHLKSLKNSWIDANTLVEQYRGDQELLAKMAKRKVIKNWYRFVVLLLNPTSKTKMLFQGIVTPGVFVDHMVRALGLAMGAGISAAWSPTLTFAKSATKYSSLLWSKVFQNKSLNTSPETLEEPQKENNVLGPKLNPDEDAKTPPDMHEEATKTVDSDQSTVDRDPKDRDPEVILSTEKDQKAPLLNSKLDESWTGNPLQDARIIFDDLKTLLEGETAKTDEQMQEIIETLEAYHHIIRSQGQKADDIVKQLHEIYKAYKIPPQDEGNFRLGSREHNILSYALRVNCEKEELKLRVIKMLVSVYEFSLQRPLSSDPLISNRTPWTLDSAIIELNSKNQKQIAQYLGIQRGIPRETPVSLTFSSALPKDRSQSNISAIVRSPNSKGSATGILRRVSMARSILGYNRSSNVK